MLLYWVALSLLLADQLVKQIIIQRLVIGESVPVIKSIFHITFVQNTGIAFGLLQDNPGILTALITVCVLLLAFFSYKILSRPLIEKIAYGLILGGALGNLVDRFRFGWVVDFLDFRIWPVFNLADSGITIGVILFAWRIIFIHERAEKNPNH